MCQNFKIVIDSKTLKISALLFCLPILFIFYIATVNNLDGPFRDILFVYAYITVFSFGLPIFIGRAGYLSWKENIRGIRSMRWLSVLMLLLILLLWTMQYFIPADILCSETKGVCPIESKITRLFVFLLSEAIYAFSFFVSTRYLRLKKP